MFHHPELTSGQTSLIRIHYSIGTVWLSGTPKSVQRSFSFSTRILPRATHDSDTKTLQSLLLMRCLQLDNMISAIRGFTYAGRSSPRYKHYNAPISMYIVMDGDEYLYKKIPTNKQRRFRRLQGNHSVQIMQLCRSKIFSPNKDSSGGYLYISFPIEKGVGFWLPHQTL